MNKGLDLIKRQQPEFINDFPTGNISIGVTEEELIELEKELKVLNIFKELFDFDLAFRFPNNQPMLMIANKHGGGSFFVTISEDKYDLLKEVLS
jgi:hypothetical protein